MTKVVLIIGGSTELIPAVLITVKVPVEVPENVVIFTPDGARGNSILVLSTELNVETFVKFRNPGKIIKGVSINDYVIDVGTLIGY